MSEIAEHPLQQAVRAYEAGSSLESVAALIGVAPATARRRLVEAGVETRSFSEAATIAHRRAGRGVKKASGEKFRRQQRKLKSAHPISAYAIEEGLRAELTSRCPCGWSATGTARQAMDAFRRHRVSCERSSGGIRSAT